MFAILANFPCFRVSAMRSVRDSAAAGPALRQRGV